MRRGRRSISAAQSLVVLSLLSGVAAVGLLTAGTVVGADATYSASSDSSASLGARACYPKAVQDNPTFAYSFNEDSGATAEDGSGNGNDGTIQGTTVRTAIACSTDRSGSYARFDGTEQDGGGNSSMVSTPVSATDPKAFTIETWFRVANGSAGAPMVGFADTRTAKSSGASDRMLYTDDGGLVKFGIWTGAYTVVTSPSRYDDGAWHMAQATLSPTEMKLYLDGSLVASGSGPSSTQAYTGWWRIGFQRTSGWTSLFAWKGDLDDVAVYPTALTAAQVAAHYSAGR